MVDVCRSDVFSRRPLNEPEFIQQIHHLHQGETIGVIRMRRHLGDSDLSITAQAAVDLRLQHHLGKGDGNRHAYAQQKPVQRVFVGKMQCAGYGCDVTDGEEDDYAMVRIGNALGRNKREQTTLQGSGTPAHHTLGKHEIAAIIIQADPVAQRLSGQIEA